MVNYQVTIIPFIYCSVAETCLRPYGDGVGNYGKVRCVFLKIITFLAFSPRYKFQPNVSESNLHNKVKTKIFLQIQD